MTLMARFLLSAMPFSGHVTPICAIAAALVERGHDVRVYTGARFATRIEATGARFVPWQQAPDFDENDLPAVFPRVTEKPGIRQLMINMQDVFVATAPDQVADLRDEWDRDPWDALVAEEVSPAAGMFAEVTGCRWATVAIASLNLQSRQGPPAGLGIAPGTNPMTRARDAALRGLVPLMARPLRAPLDRARAVVGLGPAKGIYDAQVFSPQLILATGVAALDYGRTDRPDHLHWVGTLRPPVSPRTGLPSWWGDLDGRRVVHVTQGTQNVDVDDLIRPTLDALAGDDVLVVATTGIAGRNALPFPVPANARVAGFIPHDLLLPRVDAVVSNGGWGSVVASLAAGVPLVLAGTNLDKPEVSARAAWTGAGINLRTRRPTPAAVRAAVRRVIEDAAHTTAARRIADELDATGGAGGAADLLVDFALGDLPR